MAIKNIKGKGTLDIFDGKNSRNSGKVLKAELHEVAREKLDMLNAAAKLEDLKSPPGNRLHALKAVLVGFHAISTNDQYRIIFRWTIEGPTDVEITDYHE